MGKLEGKIAIVTGSGKGIGRDAALAIAAEGATVVTVARTQSDLDETVKMIEDAGGTAISLSRDLTDGEQVADMVKTVVDKYGRIDILVNNAGGYPKEIYKNIEHQAIKIWEWSEEQWDQIIKTNLRIPFLVTKNVVPVMIKQGKGDIVNVSSRMGRIASQMGAYAVAKGGIVTMTKTTAIQTKEYGIKCNAVSPGIVDTPGQRVYNHSVGQDGCPMGSSKDVAKAIIYLLADSPAVMTGQSLSSVSDKAYSIREGMKTAEERMKKLQKLIEYGKNYTEYKPIHDELKKLQNGWTNKRDKYEEAHRAELTLWNAASRYLHANLPKGTKTLPIAEWEQEYADLKTQRDSDYTKLKETRAEVAELQKIRRCVDIALRADQPEQTQSRTKRHDIDR